MKRLVCDCGLENQIILAGPRQQGEVLEAYHRHELFVLACVVAQSGDQDGIPVVLMEAMALQIPVVSTQVSGIPELVQHQQTGWLAPPRDATALAEAIVHLADDEELRTHLARNGRALVEREFEIKGNVKRLIGVFRQVA